MRRFLGQKRILVFFGILLPVAGLLAVACNYHWYPIGTTFQFQKLQVVSAVPAVKDDQGNLVPQCMPGGKIDGLILTMNLLGTELKSQQSQVGDKDVSMRPGDIVKPAAGGSRFRLEEGVSVTNDQFKVKLEFMEPLPDGNLTDPGNLPAGVDTTPTFVRYEGNYESVGGYYARYARETGHMGVALLIDQSGSMKGYIDRITKAEVKDDTKPVDIKNIEEYMSDKYNVRLSAVREFFQNLNDTEAGLVFKVNELEQRPKAVCANPDNLSEEDLRADCFGTSRKRIFDPYGGEDQAAFDLLQQGSNVKGRMPLWASMLDLYNFMKKVRTEVRHIVVIDDGPDTCAPNSPDRRTDILVVKEGKGASVMSQAVCSDTDYATFRDAVLADLEARKNGDTRIPAIHISFVQFQSQGYREVDPRQQEIACLTGGQYVFVNAQDLSMENPDAMEAALKEALLKVRYTLAGSWKVGVTVPALSDPRVPKGAELAMEGYFTLLAGKSPLAREDISVPLKVFAKSDVGGVNNLDHRLVIRVPCEADGDCSWYPARVASCNWYEPEYMSCRRPVCDKDVKVCRFELAEDGTSCDDELSCTGKDRCILGYCGGELVGAVKPTGPCTGKKKGDPCDDGNICTTGETCDADNGNCVGGTPDPSKDGLPCDDGKACTKDTKCDNGVCTGGTFAPKDTPCESDNNPCTDDLCDEVGGCQHKPKPDGSSAGTGSSSDLCMTDLKCQGGQPTGGSKAADATPCGSAGLCLDGVCEQVPSTLSPMPSQCIGK